MSRPLARATCSTPRAVPVGCDTSIAGQRLLAAHTGPMPIAMLCALLRGRPHNEHTPADRAAGRSRDRWRATSGSGRWGKRPFLVIISYPSRAALLNDEPRR